MKARTTSASLYRAVWRWHFYAGIIVLPVLAWLAITGGLYLYKPEIERLVYRDLIQLEQVAQPMPIRSLIDGAERQTSSRVLDVMRPADPTESWRLTIERPGGERRTVFVDPGSGSVLGDTHVGGIMQTVRELHSLVIAGPIGNVLIEIVAGWAIILTLTGFYLWWPRSGQKALALRGPPKRRLFWRDLHASTGALTGAVVLFLAITGLPWSMFWGEQLHSMVTAGGLGRPEAPGRQSSTPGTFQRVSPVPLPAMRWTAATNSWSYIRP